ncbi:MAG TPA: hypothetical protein DCR14_05000 [Acidimicrobiaceae bacterium]|nr:hypothetical protein [Acidimicrobiaceae bacterium]
MAATIRDTCRAPYRSPNLGCTNVPRMPYPKKNLNANETIALDMHPHWWYFAEPAGSLFGSVVLGIILLTQTESGSDTRKYLGMAVVALMVATALWLVGRYLKWITTNFVITSQRLIFRNGVIAKSGVEIPLERINNVNFSQGVFERMLGAGDLLIESGGQDGQSRFTDVRRPDKVQNLVHAQIDAIHSRRTGAPAAASSGTTDVTEQLERLEGLLDRGTITLEEFETQKRRLLEG